MARTRVGKAISACNSIRIGDSEFGFKRVLKRSEFSSEEDFQQACRTAKRTITAIRRLVNRSEIDTPNVQLCANLRVIERKVRQQRKVVFAVFSATIAPKLSVRRSFAPITSSEPSFDELNQDASLLLNLFQDRAAKIFTAGISPSRSAAKPTR